MSFHITGFCKARYHTCSVRYRCKLLYIKRACKSQVPLLEWSYDKGVWPVLWAGPRTRSHWQPVELDDRARAVDRPAAIYGARERPARHTDQCALDALA